MAATVTANLTLINACDATTNWSAGAVDTDVKVQGTGCLGLKVSAATSASIYTIASFDASSTHIYVWMLCTTPAILDTQANGGLRIRIGDGTNTGDWYVGGSDTYFGGWRCFVIDTSRSFDANSGTAPNKTACTRVGVVCKTTGMVSGAANNFFWDVLRYGTGLTITGGTSGDPGTFDNIVTEDLANAYGIIRKEGGVYFLQGRLIFGDTGSGNTVFRDSGKILVFENKPVASTLYRIQVQEGSGSTEFRLGAATGSGESTLATAGVVIDTAGPLYDLLFDDADITTLQLYGVNAKGADDVQIGTTSVTLTGSGVSIVDCTFNTTGQVVINVSGSPLYLRNTIAQNTNATAGLLIAQTGSPIFEGGRWKLVQSDCFDSLNDTVVQTLTVKNHDFSTDDRFVQVRAKKTWDIVDPIWSPTTSDQTDITFGANDANQVNEKFSLDLTVQKTDGTALQNAYTYVYEGLTNQDLPTANRQATDVNGLASSNILKRTFTDNAGTSLTVASRGDFALKVYKYTYSPYVAALTVNAGQDIGVPLAVDTAIMETNQATAITNGSGITVVEHTTQPLKVINYDGGTVAFVAGNVVTGATSGASGTVREVLGTTGSGTLVLHTWNGTAFQNDENLQVSGVTRAVAHTSGGGSFDGSYRWEVRCNSLALNTVYEYLAARMAESSPSATFIDAIEWGEAEQSQLMYTGGAGYFTSRNAGMSRGVWLSERGAGTVAYMTSNAGSQYVPPVQYSFTLTGLVAGTEVRIYRTSDNVELAGTESSGTSFSYNYVYESDVAVYIVVFHLDYKEIRLTNTLSNANQSIPMQQQTDRVYLNP